MALIDHRCPQCGHRGSAVVRQSALSDTWSQSFSCTRCGCQTEADGAELPPDIREAIIRDEGEWMLVFADRAVPPQALARVLREFSHLSTPEALAAARHALAEGHIRGTKAEMQRLGTDLRAAAIAALLRPAGPVSPAE